MASADGLAQAEHGSDALALRVEFLMDIGVVLLEPFLALFGCATKLAVLGGVRRHAGWDRPRKTAVREEHRYLGWKRADYIPSSISICLSLSSVFRRVTAHLHNRAPCVQGGLRLLEPCRPWLSLSRELAVMARLNLVVRDYWIRLRADCDFESGSLAVVLRELWHRVAAALPRGSKSRASQAKDEKTPPAGCAFVFIASTTFSSTITMSFPVEHRYRENDMVSA